MDTKTACKDAAEQLALCIEQTPCVKEGGAIMECLKAKDIGDCEVSALDNQYHQKSSELSAAPVRDNDITSGRQLASSSLVECRSTG